MKNNDIIPFKKELSFIFKLVLSISMSTLLGIYVLYLLMDEGLGNNFANAFHIIKKAYQNMDFYILIAVFFQFLIASIFIYFISLYFSHKIAGPMYRLKMLIEDYLSNKHVGEVKFRETDFMGGVAENFSHFFIYHNKRTEKLEEIQKLIKKIDNNITKENRKEMIDVIKNKLNKLGN